MNELEFIFVPNNYTCGVNLLRLILTEVWYYLTCMYGFIQKGILTWLENEESKAQYCQQLNIIFCFFPWKKKKMITCMHACRLFSFVNDL